MKSFISLLVSLVVAGSLLLTSSTAVSAQKVYTVAEQQPEYPGGPTALSRYLAATIKVPGVFVRKNYNTGPVSARFIIDDLGYVHDVRIVAKPLDKKMKHGMEVYMANIIAAVEKMPRWKPGEVGGKPVTVFYTLPIEVNIQ